MQGDEAALSYPHLAEHHRAQREERVQGLGREREDNVSEDTAAVGEEVETTDAA